MILSFMSILIGCRGNVPPFELVEQEPKVVLHFRILNGSSKVEMNESFDDLEGYKVHIQDLAFYISDVALLRTDGEFALSEVELIDFMEFDTEGQPKIFGRSYSYLVPKGVYAGLTFNLGLPPNLNDSDPTTYPNDNPLSSFYSNMYWDWATKYRFIRFGTKIESKDEQNIDFNMQIHTGLDSLFRPSLTHMLMVEFDSFERDTIFIDIDWNELFHTGDSNQINLSDSIFTHGTGTPEDVEIAIRFTDNMARAFSVKSQ